MTPSIPFHLPPLSLFFHCFIPVSSVTFLLLGVGIPMGLSKEGRKNSKYISMIEGRHGELGAAHGDHGHDAHHH